MNLLRKIVRSQELPQLAAGIGIAITFIALNYRAFTGFFQDDELDTLSWAPSLRMTAFAAGLLKPTFDTANFRPPAHLYFALMGRAYGLNFPPYMAPIFCIHLLNALLLYLLLRKLDINRWCAVGGVAFFTLSASAMDAYWKPMYVYDLLSTTFSLASIVLFAHRRWILSFIAFWFAYKSKELAVMLPAVLLAYEAWFGKRRFVLLIPFFAASLSFGLQGLLLNPNKNNDYTFRFTFDALTKTGPFYARRFLFLPFSGLALLLLAAVRDRRAWFGLTAAACFLFTLLFLPGRLFEAYIYLPLACVAIALSAAASHTLRESARATERPGVLCPKPAWLWLALVLWFPWNLRQLHREQRATLALDSQVRGFVEQLQRWTVENPQVTTLIYTGVPNGFHHWGVTAAWNIAHKTIGLPALYVDWPEAAKAAASESVAYGVWDARDNKLVIQVHPAD